MSGVTAMFRRRSDAVDPPSPILVSNKLHDAVKKGDKVALRKLLNKKSGKVLIKAKDENNLTPILWALRLDNVEFFEMFLNHLKVKTNVLLFNQLAEYKYRH